MSLSGIAIGQPNTATTLASLSASFKEARPDQHLRFSDAKGLHTHGSVELTKADFLSKFRVSAGLQMRDELRQNATAHVKQAIDNQYGKGMGERVFAKMHEDGTLGSGVTLRDLGSMQTEAEAFREADMAKANQRLGGTGMGAVIKDMVDTHPSLGGIDGDRQAVIRDKIASVVAGMPPTSTPAEFRRAAEGVIIHDHIVELASTRRNGGGVMGFREDQKPALQTLLDKCFMPAAANADPDVKALAGRPVATLLAVLEQTAGKLDVETPSKILNKVDASLLAGMNTTERAQIVYDSLKAETTKVLSDGEGAIKSFMRGESSAPHFDVFKLYLDPHFKPMMTEVATALNPGDGSKLEYRETQLGLQNRPATDALSAFNQFDAGMTKLFGGADPTSIRASAAAVPQDACDMLATAHKAMADAEAALVLDGKTIAGEVARNGLGEKVNVNMLFLRTLTPSITVHAGLKKDANLLTFSKFVQNVGNGIDPTDPSAKERVPGEVASQLQGIFQKWEDAGALWMAEIVARGRPIV